MLSKRIGHVESLAVSGSGGVTFDESVRLEPVHPAGFKPLYPRVIPESIAGSTEGRGCLTESDRLVPAQLESDEDPGSFSCPGAAVHRGRRARK